MCGRETLFTSLWCEPGAFSQLIYQAYGEITMIERGLYYRKQMRLPIIECGAKDAPFIRSIEIASDKFILCNHGFCTNDKK